MEIENPQKLIIDELVDAKAINVTHYDMEGKSSIADHVIVCHGTSTAHVQGIADKVYLSLKRETIMPLGVEGAEEGAWILMDYNAVIVHIFVEDLRDHYALDTIYEGYAKEVY